MTYQIDEKLPGPERRSHIYLIGAAGRVKVGIAIDPRRRLSNLQTGQPERLTLERTLPVPHGQALAIEAALHGLLSWAAVRGEWFALRPDEAAPVLEMFVDGRAEDAALLAGALRAYVGASVAYARSEGVRSRFGSAARAADMAAREAAWAEYEVAHAAAVSRGLPAGSGRC